MLKQEQTWKGVREMANLELEKLIIDFANTNRTEGKSPQTVAWYSQMLRAFVAYLVATGEPPVLASLTIMKVREYVAHEQQRGLAPNTVHGKVRTLKAFDSWLVREGYVEDHLLKNLKRPRLPSILIDPLTDDEINQLVRSQDPMSRRGSRNLALLTLMLDTGLRLGEVTSLRYEDTHIDGGFIKVMGKGSKERIIPMGATARKLLWRYIIHFRPEPRSSSDDFIFLSPEGTQLSAEGLKSLFRRWGTAAGVPRLHAHLCRHTFATNFLVRGCGDVFRLQLLLGHSSLEMVRRYVHLASAQAMLQSPPTSPMDQIDLGKVTGTRIDRALDAAPPTKSHPRGLNLIKGRKRGWPPRRKEAYK